MKLPEIKVGDLFYYWGSLNDEPEERVLLLISEPEEITVSGSEQKYKFKFLYNEQVIERDVDLYILLSACDIVRNGVQVWNHISPVAEPEKMKELKKLCGA